MSAGTELWAHLTTMLAIRAGSRCERCGRPFTPGGVEPSRHHRRPGKMGGREYDPTHDTLVNLLLLCGGRLAGVLGCHGYTESHRAESYARGFLVREHDDPADVPVVLHSGRVVLLDLYGRYVDTGPNETPAYVLTPRP